MTGCFAVLSNAISLKKQNMKKFKWSELYLYNLYFVKPALERTAALSHFPSNKAEDAYRAILGHSSIQNIIHSFILLCLLI